jgi:hypothetical protein
MALVRSSFCALHGEQEGESFHLVTANRDGLEIPVCVACVSTLIVTLGIGHNALAPLWVDYRNAVIAHSRRQEKHVQDNEQAVRDVRHVSPERDRFPGGLDRRQ